MPIFYTEAMVIPASNIFAVVTVTQAPSSANVGTSSSSPQSFVQSTTVNTTAILLDGSMMPAASTSKMSVVATVASALSPLNVGTLSSSPQSSAQSTTVNTTAILLDGSMMPAASTSKMSVVATVASALSPLNVGTLSSSPQNFVQSTTVNTTAILLDGSMMPAASTSKMFVVATVASALSPLNVGTSSSSPQSFVQSTTVNTTAILLDGSMMPAASTSKMSVVATVASALSPLNVGTSSSSPQSFVQSTTVNTTAILLDGSMMPAASTSKMSVVATVASALSPLNVGTLSSSPQSFVQSTTVNTTAILLDGSMMPAASTSKMSVVATVASALSSFNVGTLSSSPQSFVQSTTVNTTAILLDGSMMPAASTSKMFVVATVASALSPLNVGTSSSSPQSFVQSTTVNTTAILLDGSMMPAASTSKMFVVATVASALSPLNVGTSSSSPQSFVQSTTVNTTAILLDGSMMPAASTSKMVVVATVASALTPLNVGTLSSSPQNFVQSTTVNTTAILLDGSMMPAASTSKMFVVATVASALSPLNVGTLSSSPQSFASSTTVSITAAFPDGSLLPGASTSNMSPVASNLSAPSSLSQPLLAQPLLAQPLLAHPLLAHPFLAHPILAHLCRFTAFPNQSHKVRQKLRR